MAKKTLESIISKSVQKYSYVRQKILRNAHIQKILGYARTITYKLASLLKKYHKQCLDKIAKAEPLLFFKNPFPYLSQAKETFLAALQKGDLYLQKSMQIPSNPFHLLLTFFVIAFIALNLLSASNPFRLLFPAFSFPIPPREERELVTFYAISRKEASLLAMQKLILVDDDIELRLKTLAFLLAKPLKSKIKTGQVYADLEVLPLLGNSIRRVWRPFPKDIIIDLSKDAIDHEIRIFTKLSSNTKRKTYYIDAFFRAFSASIFQTEEDLQSIEFWLDGKSERLPGMNFDLRKKWRPSSIMRSIQKGAQASLR